MEGKQIEKEKILEELETNEIDIISIYLSIYLCIYILKSIHFFEGGKPTFSVCIYVCYFHMHAII